MPHLLLSQNLMTLLLLLRLWVSMMRLKRVSSCSCPSISIRPRKNQWRLCSLHTPQMSRKDNPPPHKKNGGPGGPHLLD